MRRMPQFVCAAILLLAGMLAAPAQTPGDPAQKGSPVSNVPSDVVKELAPTGKLRAAINLGNPVLAQGTPEVPRGVTVDLARELARRTSLALELVPFTAAGKVFEALQAGAWDVAFLAIEPVRAAEIFFTAP
jgi:polar amino acid transport system substrate-binding protein